MAPRVLLVDDHRLLRAGLRGLLAGRGFDVVGEAGTGAEAVVRARELRPDIVLMDLNMPGMGGLEATRLIVAELPEVAVVILTASEAESDLFEAVKSGAQGYLLKSLDPDQLAVQLAAVGRGEPALTPHLAARLLTELARPSAPPKASPTVSDAASVPAGTPDAAAGPRGPGARAAELVEPLTAREREVLELLVAGKSNEEIAAALVVSENTVKYHLKNIFGKLHLRNRAQVVAYALRHDLYRPPGGA